MPSLGYCMISKTQIQHVYGDILPSLVLLVTLILHVPTQPSTFQSFQLSKISSSQLPFSLQASVSVLLLFYPPPPSNCIKHSTSYLLRGHASFLPYFPFPYHYSSNPSFPEGAGWRCDRMMSHQCSPVSVNDCQLGPTASLLNIKRGTRLLCRQFGCSGMYLFTSVWFDMLKCNNSFCSDNFNFCLFSASALCKSSLFYRFYPGRLQNHN